MLKQALRPMAKHLGPVHKLCDYATIHRFAVLSDDFNPIHVDREFAAASPMGGIIAHGPLSLGLVFQMLQAELTAELKNLFVDVKFRRPVRENDTIAAGGELRDGTRTYAIWVKNQQNEVVVEGVARIIEAASATSLA